jgi:hypothetical protein
MGARRSPAGEARRATAIDLLVSGMHQDEVAKALRIDRSTLFRWSRDPDFKAALDLRRREVWSEIPARLRDMTLSALSLMASKIRDGDYGAAREWIRIVGPGLIPLLEHTEDEAVGQHRVENSAAISGLNSLLLPPKDSVVHRYLDPGEEARGEDS